MQAEHLHQLIPDRLHRVEGRHRLLEDHGDTVAAHLVHLIRRQRQQLLPLKADRAGHHLTVRLGQQPHDGEGGDALAAAGLADKAEGLARLHREADAVEHLDLAVIDGELHLEIAHLEDGGLGIGHGLPLLNDAHRSCRAG
ncbi:hypothetical protein D3C79_834520 [compost metagenome]